MSCSQFRMSLEEDKDAFISKNFVSSCLESTIWDKLVHFGINCTALAQSESSMFC